MIPLKSGSEILVKQDYNLREAMRHLEASAEGIVFVVQDDLKFLGTLTDGDVRRGLLGGAKLTDPLSSYYNRNAFSMNEAEYDLSVARQVMATKRFRAIPILSEDGYLVGYERNSTSSTGSSRKGRKIDIPVVIMAGGKGTRMAPFTNVLPKPLIPIGDKTILELIISEFQRFGVHQFFFTINYKGEMIRAYFECIEHEYKITYLKETGYFGTAGSLSLMPKNINGTIIVSNCDIIVKADFADVLDFHYRSGAMLTVLSSIQHHEIPYGVIRFEQGGIVTSLEEKPELSFCINTGVYVLETSCIDYIPEGQVFHMTNLMESLIAAGKRVVTYPVNENEYLDIGQWEEYRKVVNQLTLMT